MPFLVGEGLVLAVLSDDTDHYPDRYSSAQRIIPAPIRTARGSSDMLEKLNSCSFGSFPILS